MSAGSKEEEASPIPRFHQSLGRYALRGKRAGPEGKRTKPEPPVVAIAGGLFTQEGLSVQRGFLRTLAAQYGTGVRQVDFTRDAAQVIDAWAERETAGRIRKVFDDLAPQTLLVIANTVYLKAEWETPFTGPSERNAAFTRADGTAVRTDLIRRTGSLPYASGEGWQAVELRDLTQAVHHATVTVDEWGTEAAAVTALALGYTGPPEPVPEVEVEVRADRPFAFAIIHRPTLTPLFIGQVTDPTAKG
ncbi:serpin family protein [Streptosporangium sp. NPDC001681]|uniref:serpin family protein n=1 Tax=Streptosporangium sp. NPDC001681 TaxID=3154395 RepID=UPI0033342573